MDDLLYHEQKPGFPRIQDGSLMLLVDVFPTTVSAHSLIWVSQPDAGSAAARL